MGTIQLGCSGYRPTGRTGVLAIDGGYGGYGWRCPTCGIEDLRYDHYGREDSAAAGLRRHRQQGCFAAHPPAASGAEERA